MKKNKNIVVKESVTIVLLIALIVILSRPQMSMMIELRHVLTVAALVVLSVYLSFLWRDTARFDERAELHAAIATKFGYSLGIFLLAIATMIQYLQIHVSASYAIVLGVMLLSRPCVFHWLQRYR